MIEILSDIVPWTKVELSIRQGVDVCEGMGHV